MKHLNDCRGFTLLELLVAISLLAIGIFSVITMQITGIKSNSIANRLSTATALAQEAMDDIMAWDISDARVNTTAANVVYDLNGPNTGGTDITITGAGTFRAAYSTTIDRPGVGTTLVTINIFRVVNGTADGTPLTSLTGYKRVS